MATGIEELKAELAEAEGFLYASQQALHTHGHQQATWSLLRADSDRVLMLRELIATAEAGE
jgi:hypothetical protein